MKAGDARATNLGWVIGVCMLIATLEGYDTQAFGVAAPHLAPELGLNAAQIGWAGSMANFGLVIGALIGGWAADRWGRKRVLLASVLAFSAFSLATAFAHGFEPLLAARFLTGLGFGGVMANLISVAAEIARRPPRGDDWGDVRRHAGRRRWSRCSRAWPGARRLAPLFIVGGALPLLIAPLVVWLLPEAGPSLPGPRPQPGSRPVRRARSGGPAALTTCSPGDPAPAAQLAAAAGGRQGPQRRRRGGRGAGVQCRRRGGRSGAGRGRRPDGRAAHHAAACLARAAMAALAAATGVGLILAPQRWRA
jgi:MFS family permease